MLSSGAEAQPLPGMRLRVEPSSGLARLAAVAFLLVSLFVPRLLSGIAQLEDGLLVVCVVLAAGLPLEALLARRTLTILGVAVALLGLTGGVGELLGHETSAYITRSTVGLVKEIGRLGKIMLVAWSMGRIIGATDRRGKSLDTIFFLALVAHTLLGLAQYFHLDPFASWITRAFLGESLQVHNLSEGALEVGGFRATGTVYNANVYGYVALMLAIFPFAGSAPVPRRRTLSILALVTVAIFFSQSRTAYVGLLILAYLAVTRGTGAVWPKLVAMAAIAATVVLGAARLAATLDLGLGVFFAKRPQYLLLPQLVLSEAPLVGYGLGAGWFLPADSDYLYAMIRGGFLAVAVLIGLYGALLAAGKGNGAYRAVVWMAIIGGLTNGVFFGNEITPLVLMVLMRAAQLRPQDYSWASRRPAEQGEG